MVRTVYLPAVLKLCPNVDTPQRLAALIEFAFNLGARVPKVEPWRRPCCVVWCCAARPRCC